MTFNVDWLYHHGISGCWLEYYFDTHAIIETYMNWSLSLYINIHLCVHTYTHYLVSIYYICIVLWVLISDYIYSDPVTIDVSTCCSHSCRRPDGTAVQDLQSTAPQWPDAEPELDAKIC